MSTSNKGTGIILAVVATLVVAGAGGGMLGYRYGQNSMKETAPIITVNGDAISKADFYDRLKAGGGSQAADQMINEKLVGQEAKKANITISDADIEAKLKEIKTQAGGDEAFKAALQQYNTTEAEVKSNIRTQLIVDKILTPTIPVDDATLQKYLDGHVDKYDKRQFHVAHILVNSVDEAKAVKAELDKGADFATVAKAKSIDKAANEKGGDLGTFDRTAQMDPDFLKGVFALKQGDISQPIQSQFGFHIVKVLEVKGDLPKLADVKEDVKKAVINEGTQQKYPTWIKELKDKAKIDYSDKSLKPAAPAAPAPGQ